MGAHSKSRERLYDRARVALLVGMLICALAVGDIAFFRALGLSGHDPHPLGYYLIGVMAWYAVVVFGICLRHLGLYAKRRPVRKPGVGWL